MIERPEQRARRILDELDDAGRVRAREALDRAAADGVSERTMRRTARAVGFVPEREGFGPASTVWWARAGDGEHDDEGTGRWPTEAQGTHDVERSS